MEPHTPEQNGVRRGNVLGEISQVPSINQLENQVTPKSSSPDEMVIQQRGPRVIPATWSPVDCNKFNILEPSRMRTPEKQPPVKEIRPGLRRRLTLSPVKSASVNDSLIIKKIKSLSNK